MLRLHGIYGVVCCIDEESGTQCTHCEEHVNASAAFKSVSSLASYCTFSSAHYTNNIYNSLISHLASPTHFSHLIFNRFNDRRKPLYFAFDSLIQKFILVDSIAKN
jgi:hypothetical protein